MGLADIHTHTIFSYDGTASVPAVLKRARQVGLNIIAITDHDEIRGAEITSAEGDVLEQQE